MTLPKWVLPAGIAVALLALCGAVRSCTIQSERARGSAALLAQAKDSVKGLHDSLAVARQDLSTARAKIDTVWRVRTVALGSADSSHHRADSLVILASADSVARCRLIEAAYMERTSECAALRKVVALDSVGLKMADSTLHLTETRLAEAVTTTAALRDKLNLVSKPYTCKLWFIPCPSRGTLFVVGLLGGAAGTYALVHK